jgi:phospholipid/cholesterol/gamma-HCH transport system substrate-binding protein
MGDRRAGLVPAVCYQRKLIMALPVARGTLRTGNVFETVVSGLVILVAVAFLAFMVVRTGTGHIGSYPLRIRMADAAGLTVGSEVRLSGTKVGSVAALWLNPSDYSATVEVRLRDDLMLPTDSLAGVSSSALGDPYLAITPGHAARTVAPDGELVVGKGSRRRPG